MTSRIAAAATVVGSVGLLLHAIVQGQSGAPAASGSAPAHITFTRHSSPFGAATRHVIIDRGDNVTRNLVVIQKNVFPPEKGNFDTARNVKVISLKIDSDTAIVLSGKAPSQWKQVKQVKGLNADALEGLAPTVVEFFKLKDGALSVFAAPDEANAAIVATIKSGGTVEWDRPEGTMRLEVITTGGDQAFAPPFRVEAGRRYVVDYKYMSAKFTLTETK
jgi:hypothetical protein